MIGGGTRFSQDAPPFTTIAREPCAYCGLNLVGMRRHGFSNDTIEHIHNAYRIIYQKGLPLVDALAQIKESLTMTKEIEYIISFIESSKRGFIH